MVLVRPSQVPEYLREGELFTSLDQSSDEAIEVPDGALKPDLEVTSATDLDHIFTSISFWIIVDIPYALLDHILANRDLVVDEKFYDQYPDLKLVRKLQQEPKNDEDRFKLTIAFGSMYILKYLLARKHKLKNTSNACILAARAGHLHMMTHFHSLGAKLHIITLKAAFSGGHMACLEYMATENLMGLIQNQHLCLSGSFFPDPDAVFVPDLPTLQYAVAQGCVMNARLMYTAAELGRLDIMTYAQSVNCVWDETTITRAAEMGQLPCLAFAVEHNCPTGYMALCKAAEQGHLHCMVYLHEHGCPWSEECFYYAAAYSHLDCLIYAHTHGCPVNKGVYRIARLKKLTEIVAYLERHGVTVEDVNNEFPDM